MALTYIPMKREDFLKFSQKNCGYRGSNSRKCSHDQRVGKYCSPAYCPEQADMIRLLIEQVPAAAKPKKKPLLNGKLFTPETMNDKYGEGDA